MSSGWLIYVVVISAFVSLWRGPRQIDRVVSKEQLGYNSNKENEDLDWDIFK